MDDRTHIELVCADSGWFVRKRADNGETIWHTEIYESREHAEHVAEQEVMFVGLESYEVVDLNEET